MSKIGRRPISVKGLQVTVDGNTMTYKGPKSFGSHVVPDILSLTIENDQLVVTTELRTIEAKRMWGLHRALIANALKGASVGFERSLRIVGLGYKAVAKGKDIEFSLGFSHKVPFEMPQEVSVEIDKTGQKLTLKSSNKEILGLVCSKIRSLRPPEPYKGTGIQYDGEVILRKAGKTKA